MPVAHCMQALDELQTHLLLKRVIKEKGLKPSTPAQQQPEPAAGALLVLPAPSNSSPAPAPAAAGGGAAQAVLSAEDVQAVADAYGQERAYLVKCQHLILKTARTCLHTPARDSAASLCSPRPAATPVHKQVVMAAVLLLSLRTARVRTCCCCCCRQHPVAVAACSGCDVPRLAGLQECAEAAAGPGLGLQGLRQP